MRWIQVQKDEPLSFRFRYSHNSLEAWKTVDLKKRSKGRPPVFTHLALPQLYPSGRAFKKQKMDDLFSLFEFVPPVYHDFYKNLHTGDIQSESEDEE